MTNLKKLISIGSIVLAIGATSVTAFAASKYTTPAEAAAGLTGRTVESVTTERYESRKTYGTIANDAGKLAEFQVETLEMRKDSLALQVASGRITQAQADAAIILMKENQLTCDGAGSGIGRGLGCGMNGGQGRGMGRNWSNVPIN